MKINDLIRLIGICLAAAPSIAQDIPPQRKPATQAATQPSDAVLHVRGRVARFDELVRTFREEVARVQGTFQDASDSEAAERATKEVLSRRAKALAPILDELTKIAEHAESDPAASAEAVGFLFSRATSHKVCAKACAIALEHHLDHDAMAGWLPGLRPHFSSPQTFQFLDAVIAKSASRTNQAAAALVQLSMLEDMAGLAPLPPEYAEHPFTKLMALVGETELTDEGLIWRIEGVIEAFGAVEVDGKTVEETLLVRLRTIRTRSRIAIGQLAPDSTGPDLDGVEFKLSDYRGRVVMLTFWGDW